MNHDSPESFDPVRVDACCLALESTSKSYKKNFVDAPAAGGGAGGRGKQGADTTDKDDKQKNGKGRNPTMCTHC